MLKVLHVITGLNRGGAEGVLARLITATCAEFDHVVVSLRDAGHFGPLLRAAGIPVHALNLDPVFGALPGIVRLRGLIGRERVDLVHTWLYHADLLGGIAARLARVRPLIWCVRNHNLDAQSIGRPTRWVARAAALLSSTVPDVIVCNSRAASREHITFGYCAARFRIIENGFDLDRFRPDDTLRAATRTEFGVSGNELLIGMVARWDRQKDHGNLISALHIARHVRPDLKLLLVGVGMDAANTELGDLLRAAGLSSQTLLAGPRDDMPAVMNALDLHVLSSRGESFPNVVAEAMACGTPVVVTDVGEAAYVVGDTGWIARPRDVQALAVAIERAAAAVKDSGRELIGIRCRERVRELFSLDRMTHHYASLWRELGAAKALHRRSD